MNFKTLVLGASLKEERYSNKAVRKLIANGIEVVAFGMRKGDVAGVEIQTEQIAFEDVHTVTLYLNPKRQEEYYDYVLSLNPKRVIFNPGTENEAFYKKLEAKNIQFEVACTLVLLSIDAYKS